MDKLPKMTMLVGIPGSGKSYFAKHLAAINSNVVVISQDDLGSKTECENALMKAVKTKNSKIILDKCNVTVKDRQKWVDYSMINKKDIVIIYFDYPCNDCVKRVLNRVGHPTIHFGKGESIVKSFYKRLESPSKNEGFKKVSIIKTFGECNYILTKLGCDPEKLKEDTSIIKFPRTHHIFDASREVKAKISAVTRDDLLLSDREIKEFLYCDVTLEEKVDGANMGISITKDYKIVFQNRSHYVCSESDFQFKGLKIWEENHLGDLWHILKPDRHILYGEWCYAKHSIHYTELPGYFLAFDIFDKYKNRFYSREKFQNVMGKTNIPMVPIIAVENLTKDNYKKKLMEYLETKSKFRDGTVEGVYIRKDEGEYLLKRCKLVRPDFIQGMKEFWAKQGLIKNIIKF